MILKNSNTYLSLLDLLMLCWPLTCQWQIDNKIKWEMQILTFIELGFEKDCNDRCFHSMSHSGSENLKKSRQKTCETKIIKKVYSWNCIFGSFKLFPSSKIDFWPFLKLQKMEFGEKNCLREIDLFDFTSFLGLDFFKFSGPLCVLQLVE